MTAQAELRARFLEAMSAAAATVNVVTTDGPAGRGGVTVSAMTSVSADGEAPTLLACVHHRSRAAALIRENGAFCANVLRDDQSAIADAFAGRVQPEPADRFATTAWTPMRSGAPRVVDGLAAFDCKVVSAERVGTHHVFIGEVGDIFLGASGAPLLYQNRTYGAPVRLSRRAGRETAMTTHRRHRMFNTKDTYPEQKLDNDLCHAVVARGATVFLRGQCPQDLDTSASIASHDPAEQTRKVMENIRQLLGEVGAKMEHIVKVVVYITDVRHREAVYRVMGEYLRGVYPVSTGITVTALARPEWLVEIDATAVIPE
jgi:flavin reductase (DIM6/NTAB) family NADH-FMN oxidoreductase RutF